MSEWYIHIVFLPWQVVEKEREKKRPGEENGGANSSVGASDPKRQRSDSYQGSTNSAAANAGYYGNNNSARSNGGGYGPMQQQQAAWAGQQVRSKIPGYCFFQASPIVFGYC